MAPASLVRLPLAILAQNPTAPTLAARTSRCAKVSRIHVAVNASFRQLSSTSSVAPESRCRQLLPADSAGLFSGGAHRGKAIVASVASKAEKTTGLGAEARQINQWSWQRQPGEPPISINYVLYPPPASSPSSSSSSSSLVLFLPSFSDVSTVDEWDAVASAVAQQQPSDAAGEARQVAILDWPGFGASGRPPLEYTAAIMEAFLVDFVKSVGANRRVVLIGAGHAAVAALKAISDGRLAGPGKGAGAAAAAAAAAGAAGATAGVLSGGDAFVAAVIAVAPTWAGPLPIVFGHTEKMRPRYAIFRSLIRAPAIGWALYRFALTSPKNMRQQYLSHVYADADNVTPSLVDARTSITRRPNARFAPASFVSGLLDSVRSREEFLSLFAAAAAAGVRSYVVASKGCPRRSKAEMQAARGVEGVEGFVEVEGALLPHEEYPSQVADAVKGMLREMKV